MRRTTYYDALSVPQILDQWPIRKALTLSDVDITHPFLTLSRQQVETHILVYMTPEQGDFLRAQGQVDINAQDDDTGDMYVMKLKWCGSYYNLIGRWGKVVRSKGLDVGQEIKICWYNACLHFSVPLQQTIDVVPVQQPPVRMPMGQDHCHWPIKKMLTSSDVDPNHPFLPLPRKSVEDHILVHWLPEERDKLRKEEQVKISCRDYETGDVHQMKLRWRGNFYNLTGKWGNIIRKRGLGAGQEIRIRWTNNCLYFSVQEEDCASTATTASWHDNWPVKKVLTMSDVDINHPFLTLPGKPVEDHILFYWSSQAREQLRNERQVGINARDDDTGELYVMKLKWRVSYYNLIGKWGKIVREKRLNVGKEIRVRWDNGVLVFSVTQ